MKRSEKVEFILRELEKLYPNPAVPLDHSDAYTLLIAVLLSAQCTDARVNTVTPKLFARASSAQEMVKLSVEEIRDIIRPCGLSPAKSKNIHRLSEILIDQYMGVVPDDMEKLEALPGVGHKTASVVMIQAFGVPAFPVDTHIHRMLYRWGLSNGSSVLQTERDAKRIFPKSTWIKLHLQIIYYAREYSPALGAKEEKDYISMTLSGKIKKLIK